MTFQLIKVVLRNTLLRIMLAIRNQENGKILVLFEVISGVVHFQNIYQMKVNLRKKVF